jgi:hypothetical protein
LIICPDEDKRFGGLSRFKSITGGDSIRGEKKGKDAFKFRYEGMVAIASNDPIFLGDSSYGLSRRLITIPFKYQVPVNERRDLEAEFTADLPAFTSYLLSLDRDWVKSILMGSDRVAQVRETEWDLTTRTDSIAGFFDDSLIFDAGAKTSTLTLYKAYQDYCKESGLSAKSIHKFTPDLIELCSIKLGLAVSGHRSSKGRSILGLRFRCEGDVYVGSDALVVEPVTLSNPVPVTDMMVMTLAAPISPNNFEFEEEPQRDMFESTPIMEKSTTEEEITVTSSIISSNTGFESVTASITKQHQVVPPSPPDDEVLLKGTKVCCVRLEKDGVVYSSRRKEFNKPNGTTEVVLQYYVDLGGEVYKWCDWDLVVAI